MLGLQVLSLLMTVKILEGDNKLDAAEWRFLLTGGVAKDDISAPPKPAWVPDKVILAVTCHILSPLSALTFCLIYFISGLDGNQSCHYSTARFCELQKGLH